MALADWTAPVAAGPLGQRARAALKLPARPPTRAPTHRPSGAVVPTRPTDSQPAPAGAPAGARKKMAAAADSRIAVAAAPTSEFSRGHDPPLPKGTGLQAYPGSRPGALQVAAVVTPDGCMTACEQHGAEPRPRAGRRRTGPRGGLGNAAADLRPDPMPPFLAC